MSREMFFHDGLSVAELDEEDGVDPREGPQLAIGLPGDMFVVTLLEDDVRELRDQLDGWLELRRKAGS